jgi:hypothetical protein
LLAAVRSCFDEYNNKGGAIVRMQDENLLYFSRACIYTVYADHPAAVKCTLTGSSCPVCYTRMRDMASTKTNQMVYRNDRDMAVKKRKYLNILNDPARCKITRKAAKKTDHSLGVVLDGVNAFETAAELRDNWVFGPSPEFDNLYQSLPQVNLHGFDEGICQKLNFAMFEMAITEEKQRHNMDATEVVVII